MSVFLRNSALRPWAESVEVNAGNLPVWWEYILLDMIYVLFALICLVAAILLIRVRFRLELSPERKFLFVGLGRSGPEFDFARHEGVIRLFGMRLKRFRLERSKTAPRQTETSAVEAEIKAASSRRRRSLGSIIAIVPESLSACWRLAVGVLKSTIVEQAEAEIEFGFDTPDVTGQAFGYYHAVAAMAPSLFGRVSLVPNWTGRSFSGSARVSIAWPVYRLIWLMTLFMWRLPIRKIIRLAIGVKEGVRDVRQ